MGPHREFAALRSMVQYSTVTPMFVGVWSRAESSARWYACAIRRTFCSRSSASAVSESGLGSARFRVAEPGDGDGDVPVAAVAGHLAGRAGQVDPPAFRVVEVGAQGGDDRAGGAGRVVAGTGGDCGGGAA
ncbi:hypothetical protein C5E08_03385 [Rathayibacter iranicus]|uniref:Uncharacterized protein n=2 Tax=Rathayibacter iranicus TaxID=59737 RepID=A0AAD1ELZ1_9MICO|nr:hypothetical protein [Rathayibacter iranicus]AZZ55034.1 hypothetical protein C7V51_03375 [Rathayibacter iranicus]MWV32244.1 hypothetical protein [Rathayibacter iranicus NCPPB 2253 = VKM Ac-1602]PPI61942.1 hypothetical protein C5E08_03385 [Rathayibacter iranicus]